MIISTSTLEQLNRIADLYQINRIYLVFLALGAFTKRQINGSLPIRYRYGGPCHWANTPNQRYECAYGIPRMVFAMIPRVACCMIPHRRQFSVHPGPVNQRQMRVWHLAGSVCNRTGPTPGESWVFC